MARICCKTCRHIWNRKRCNESEKSAAFYGKQLVEGNAKNANAYIENLAQISGYGDEFNDFIADEALRYVTDKSASEMAGSALGASGKSGTSLGIAGLSLIDDIPLPSNVIKNIAQAGVGSSDNIIRAGINSIDDVMKMGDDIAAVTNKTAKNIDEIPRGINKDGTYRLTRDQIIQDDISAVEEIVKHIDEAVDVVEEIATHTNEVYGAAEYVEEASIFGSKGGTNNFFRRANNIPNAVPNIPVMTELQQQWVDYINYNISIGNKVTVPFNSTSKLSSVMLSKIDDLSQMDIKLLDGLGNGVGLLKAKYQHPKYVQRVTYSGHEMNAIINRLKELQSKIDMSLPLS